MADDDFSKLDPEIRCFALVGQFLRTWSTMESSLHAAIGSALAVETDKLNILCENIEFGNKIYILRTLIDISKAFQEKKELQKTLVALAEYAKLRNMIAHHQFEPDVPSGGVRFVVVKARGKYDIPEEIWSPDKFKEERERIAKFQGVLDGIKTTFDAKPIPAPDYAIATTTRPQLPGLDFEQVWYSPMSRTISPELWSRLSPQAQAPPDSGPPNPKASPRTPDTPQAKE